MAGVFPDKPEISDKEREERQRLAQEERERRKAAGKWYPGKYLERLLGKEDGQSPNTDNKVFNFVEGGESVDLFEEDKTPSYGERLALLTREWDVPASQDEVNEYNNIVQERDAINNQNLQKFVSKDGGASKQELDDMMLLMGYYVNHPEIQSPGGMIKDVGHEIIVTDPRTDEEWWTNEAIWDLKRLGHTEAAERIKNSSWFNEMINVPPEDILGYHVLNPYERISDDEKQKLFDNYGPDTPGVPIMEQGGKASSQQTVYHQLDMLANKIATTLDDNDLLYSYEAINPHGWNNYHNKFQTDSFVEILSRTPVQGRSNPERDVVRANRYSHLFEKIEEQGVNIDIDEVEDDYGNMYTHIGYRPGQNLPKTFKVDAAAKHSGDSYPNRHFPK